MLSWYILIACMGLAIGSFLNVVIYRLPRGQHFTTGRSYCPHCKQQLKWYHNVPIISYVFLLGKCGFCGERISLRYPVVELMNAGLYLYFLWEFGPTLYFFIFACIASALITIFLIDLDFQIIPDVITIPGIVVGLAVSLWPGGIGIIPSAIGMLVGGGSLYLVAMLGDWLFKKESMGGGDIKLAAMLGAFLGWQKVLFVFLASAVIGLIVSIILLSFSSKLRKHRIIPFGPFLALAAMLAIVYGDKIIAFYLVNFLPAQ